MNAITKYNKRYSGYDWYVDNGDGYVSVDEYEMQEYDNCIYGDTLPSRMFFEGNKITSRHGEADIDD